MYRLPLLLFLCTHTVLAQDGEYALGARNGALSGATITLKDEWSVFNNPGAAGSAEKSAAMVSYQNRYNIPGFHVIGGGFLLTSKFLNTGLKYWKFGDELFSQQLAGLILGNRFQMVSLGLGINLLQTAIEGLDTRRVWIFEFGGRAEITEKLIFGAHVFNLRHGELHPVTMKAGLSLRPIPPLMFNLEVEKKLEIDETIKIGLEYEVISKLFIRTGISIQPNNLELRVKNTFGFGLRPVSFVIDYGISAESPLGLVHEISLTYLLKKS